MSKKAQGTTYQVDYVYDEMIKARGLKRPYGYKGRKLQIEKHLKKVRKTHGEPWTSMNMTIK